MGLAVAVMACVAVAGWRVAQWSAHSRGMVQADSYPSSTMPLSPGSYALRLPPGEWRSRELTPGTARVRELPLRLVLAPGAAGDDSSRYEALYLAPQTDSAATEHRIVVLAESPVGNRWQTRAAALTRHGQWCLVLALLSPDPPDDSLTLLLTAAARTAE